MIPQHRGKGHFSALLHQLRNESSRCIYIENITNVPFRRRLIERHNFVPARLWGGTSDDSEEPIDIVELRGHSTNLIAELVKQDEAMHTATTEATQINRIIDTTRVAVQRGARDDE